MDAPHAKKTKTSKKVFIRSFGCQMNEYDSSRMADVLQAAAGYEPTSDVEQADLPGQFVQGRGEIGELFRGGTDRGRDQLVA